MYIRHTRDGKGGILKNKNGPASCLLCMDGVPRFDGKSAEEAFFLRRSVFAVHPCLSNHPILLYTYLPLRFCFNTGNQPARHVLTRHFYQWQKTKRPVHWYFAEKAETMGGRGEGYVWNANTCAASRICVTRLAECNKFIFTTLRPRKGGEVRLSIDL